MSFDRRYQSDLNDSDLDPRLHISLTRFHDSPVVYAKDRRGIPRYVRKPLSSPSKTTSAGKTAPRTR